MLLLWVRRAEAEEKDVVDCGSGRRVSSPPTSSTISLEPLEALRREANVVVDARPVIAVVRVQLVDRGNVHLERGVRRRVLLEHLRQPADYGCLRGGEERERSKPCYELHSVAVFPERAQRSV